MSFVIPRTSLYRGSLNRGSTVHQELTLCCCFIFHRVKLTFFARDSESGNDLDANEVITMIKSGKAEGLEDYGFKVKSSSASKYCFSTG